MEYLEHRSKRSEELRIKKKWARSYVKKKIIFVLHSIMYPWMHKINYHFKNWPFRRHSKNVANLEVFFCFCYVKFVIFLFSYLWLLMLCFHKCCVLWVILSSLGYDPEKFEKHSFEKIVFQISNSIYWIHEISSYSWSAGINNM